MNDQSKPAFLLFLENDNDELVGSFNDIEGIELPSGDGEICDEIKFFNGILSHSFSEKCNLRYSDIKICICDEKGESIASFSGVADELIISHVNNTLQVALKGGSLPFISHGALSLWLERRKFLPINKNEWIHLSPIDREAWLEVALLSLPKRPFSIKGNRVEIDGVFVQDLVSFLCSFGEATFGVGGYIGRNLSALEDCLTGGFGVELPLQLYWIDSKLSEDSFRFRGENDVYKDLLDILEAANIRVIHG